MSCHEYLFPIIVSDANVFDDRIDVVPVFGRLWLSNEVVFFAVLIDASNNIGAFAMASIVFWLSLVCAKDLNSRRALDTILLSEITVFHDVDCTKFDPLVCK